MKEHTILLEKVQADITGCLRFAETKNGALLAFDIALLFGIPKIPDVSLIITLWSFWPINKKIKKAEKRKVNCDLLHFAYIAMYTRNEYLVELYKSYWKNEVVDFDKISQEEKDLAQEIVMNSRIAVRKQNLFKISLGITEMALVLLLIKTVESLLRMVIS
ncbi:MAG: hypothetical protein V8Q86_04890 [Blautia sp.]